MGSQELPLRVELSRSCPTSVARSWVSSANHTSGASGARSTGSSGNMARTPSSLIWLPLVRKLGGLPEVARVSVYDRCKAVFETRGRGT
jgi:hypothetical protein